MPSTAESLPYVQRVVRFDEIESTNTWAREQAHVSGPGVVVVVTRRQSAGRGQRGNSFHSSGADGLWVSLVVRLPDLQRHFALNRALALSACSVCRSVGGIEARIKWPNDIYAGERKTGGILLESSVCQRDAIVAGLGLNVNVEPASLPEEIRPIATSLRAQTGRSFDIEACLVALLEAFERHRHAAEDAAQLEYEQALMGVGRLARLGECEGQFEGVGADGRARLRTDGEVRYFSSGPLRFV
jgi:BirA family transcriptional regulator, biotin operon repressor / biotin---[acetyl-CoA-carboxylase] ligase